MDERRTVKVSKYLSKHLRHQPERIGLTLMLLEERMAELCERYGLRPEDLNLDLGPLGPLLPRD